MGSGQSKHRTRKRSGRSSLLKGFRRSTSVGAMPGTIDQSITPGQYSIQRLTYNPVEVIDEQLLNYDQLSSCRTKDSVTWLQIRGIPDAEVLKALAAAFGIHSLALEDVSNTHQRCKVEDYGDYLFLVSRLPRYLPDESLSSDQVSIFLGTNFLITIHEGEDIFSSVRDRIIRSRTRIREMPADYLAYAILDTVTDHYFPVIEEIGNRLNVIDELIESAVSREQRSELRSIRADLLLLRRTIWPQRDALSALMRDELILISATTQTYLRDCYDHTVQIIDVTETYRELCADLRDFHLSEISYRSNEVMKTLTIIATLFMPLSFIAGFYGMNFQHMPELSARSGYPLVILVMLTIAGSLLYWFNRKGWLS